MNDGEHGGVDGAGRQPARDRSGLSRFLLGASIGGIAGAVVGTLLSGATRNLIAHAADVCGRRVPPSERDELRFELLLQ
ncbi:MAG: YtxH domain-containing protein [Thermomicrobiales bacterium]|nr:YtxH domain-containing protein [Thermomicrobiales bacterium]